MCRRACYFGMLPSAALRLSHNFFDRSSDLVGAVSGVLPAVKRSPIN